MEKGIIITGKDFPESLSFVKAAVNEKYAVAVSVPDDEHVQIPAEPVKHFVWQRSSSVSARSFVLGAQTFLPKLTHAVLIFDTPLYVKRLHIRDSQTLAFGIDSLIASYMYMTQELISRFLKQDEGTVCFVFKPAAGKPGSRKENISQSEAFISAAASAFKTFAEQTAASFYSSRIHFFLCEQDSFAEKDDEAAEFLFSSLEASYFAKNGNRKQPLRWNRVGSKFSVGWNIFNR